jgi:hypothetical protein
MIRTAVVASIRRRHGPATLIHRFRTASERGHVYGDEAVGSRLRGPVRVESTHRNRRDGHAMLSWFDSTLHPPILAPRRDDLAIDAT